MSPVLTIIVPVYNTVEYIDQCIESVVSQEFQDYELIIIDDCSTDGSSEKIDKWKRIDSRITIIHKSQNAGVSDSRNIGLRIAKGEYVLFIDSDDWLETGILKRIIEIANQTKSDVVFAKYHKITNTVNTHTDKSLTRNVRKLSIREALIHCLPSMETNNSDVFIWDKIYRRSALIIKDRLHLMDTSFIYGEDVFWLMQLLANVSKIVMYDDYLYNYRCLRPGNTWTRITSYSSMEHCESAINTNLGVYEMLQKDYPIVAINAYQKALYYRYFAIRTASNLSQPDKLKYYSKGYVRDIIKWTIKKHTMQGAKWGVLQIVRYYKFCLFK